MEAIYIWRYTLHSSRGLNAQSARREHPGALLRLESGGVGCIHPWPALGDEPIDVQIESLREGKVRRPLAEAALTCARIDGAARAENRSLFMTPAPESHWLAQMGEDPVQVREAGFSRVKIKVGLDKEACLTAVDQWREAGFRIRLDCNESLAVGEFSTYWSALGEKARSVVDFVEDPEQWTEDGWEILRRAGVPIAVDREQESRWRSGDVRICKPARGEVMIEGGRLDTGDLCVTSYMDHAIGQMWAVACASRLAEELARNGHQRLLTCGLLTHFCFDSDPFFERLRCEGAHLLPVGGTGLGFDDLIESLPWKRLI